MKTENVVSLEILPNCSIQVLKTTIYFKDNNTELTRENYRVALNVGDFDIAQNILDEYHMNIVRATWTQEVIDKYIESQKNIETPFN